MRKNIIHQIFLYTLLFLVNFNYGKKESTTAEAHDFFTKSHTPPFENFLKKSSVVNYFRSREPSKNRRRMPNSKKIIDIIDPTDELLKFDIDKVKLAKFEAPKLSNDSRKFANDSRRYFQPPGRVLPLTAEYHHRDSYYLRARLYELMKQTMYEARDAMTIIQDLREEYNWHSLYKMGFLFSKTDDQAKLFSQLSHKFFHFCRVAREQANTETDRLDPTLLNEAFERLLNHWLETDMLVDIIRVNDANARKTLRSMRDLNQLDTWFIEEFTDVYHVQKLVHAEKVAKRKLQLLKQEQEERAKKAREEKRGYASEEMENSDEKKGDD